MFKSTLIGIICSLGLINGLNLCGDWTQYKDNKCFKVLEKIGTEEEALHNCTQLDQSSTLISIHSKEKQEFLNTLLLKYNNISNNVWIGMKYTGKAYNWLDGTETNFTNWAKDAVRDGTEPCVQMSLVKSTQGQWLDETCKRIALFVCQKKQELNLNTLKEIIENMSRDFKAENQELKTQLNSLIPLGFLYTQFPNQSSPDQLWPNMKWTEVTQQYSGLFFRAEGQGSEKFGTIQQANQSWISNIDSYAWSYSGWSGTETDYHEFKSFKQNSWTLVHPHNALYYLNFFTTGGETRPRNTAIKIWKRIA